MQLLQYLCALSPSQATPTLPKCRIDAPSKLLGWCRPKAIRMAIAPCASASPSSAALRNSSRDSRRLTSTPLPRCTHNETHSVLSDRTAASAVCYGAITTVRHAASPAGCPSISTPTAACQHSYLDHLIGLAKLPQSSWLST